MNTGTGMLFMYNFAKKIPEVTWPKIYLGQDPEPNPDVFKSRIWTRSKKRPDPQNGFN
jgi:hypothetical protein